MFSLARFPYSFTFRGRYFILALVVVSLLGRLGVWQLQRAKEKQAMLNDFASMGEAPRVLLPTEDKLGQYRGVVAKGAYLNDQQFLLDNQHHKHQFGYDVLTPLELATGEVVLVDRGWIKGHVNRGELPVIKPVLGLVSIKGRVYYPSPKSWVLGEVINNPGMWPSVIERIDLKLISKILHKPVLGFIIRQNPAQADGFVRQWRLVSLSPQKHKAYALQWFCMALAAFLLFIGLSLEQK